MTHPTRKTTSTHTTDQSERPCTRSTTQNCRLRIRATCSIHIKFSTSRRVELACTKSGSRQPATRRDLARRFSPRSLPMTVTPTRSSSDHDESMFSIKVHLYLFKLQT